MNGGGVRLLLRGGGEPRCEGSAATGLQGTGGEACASATSRQRYCAAVCHGQAHSMRHQGDLATERVEREGLCHGGG